ncbi:MAG TPA: flagellar filament capping protein FliD [Solirubrobacteraceae bacterium]|nr:flagellar filament capping protein FliD [Solirubrobacteraceae bacterium]
MASNLALSGLASGVDTSTIVEQLIAIDRQGTTRIQNRQYAVSGMQTALKDIASKLSTLKSAAAALGSESTWKQTQSIESSDSARVAVTQTGGAGIGGHSVQVNRLASSAQRGYSFAGGTAGTITITNVNDSANTMSIAVTADMTIQQVADAINAKATGPVVAAVVKDGTEDRIVFSSRTTGSQSDFNVTGGLTSEDTDYQTPVLANLDAEYVLDGVTKTAKTNVLDSVVPGLRITLKGVTTAPATIGVGEPALDRDALKTKVKAFVDAYNAVVDGTRGELTEKPIQNPTSEFQAGYGQLYGDTGLSSMLSALRRQMTNLVSAAGINDLADIGVSIPKSSGGVVSDAAKAGKLTIDDAKLSLALESNWTGVKSFFTDFSKQVSDYVDTQTGSAGVIDGRLKSADRSIATLKDQLTKANERIDAKEKRLKAQFAAMETALQNAQTQQAWLTGQIASLG